MRIISSLIGLLIVSGTAHSQTIYKELNHTNFRKNRAFNEVVDHEKFDRELLNACIFFATNEIRAKKRRSILKYNYALEKTAMIHSLDMAEMDFFSHTNPGNSSRREPEDRAREAGVQNPKIAENIIEGFIIQYTSGMNVTIPGPGEFENPKTGKKLQPHTYLSLTDDLMRMWMKSEGHRKNILSDKAIELGCGVALYYMTNFNDMPAVKATQCFQWFEAIKTTP